MDNYRNNMEFYPNDNRRNFLWFLEEILMFVDAVQSTIAE